MDSVELSKIAGAVLCALLLIFGTNTLIGMNMTHHAQIEGYTLEAGEDTADEPDDAKVAQATPAKPADPAKAADPAPSAQPSTTPADPAPSAQPGATPTAAPEATPAATPTATPATPAPTTESATGFDPAAIVAQVATADATKGKKVFKKCAGCHHSQAGKGAKSGPNLWGVVDRPKASFEGFKYSPAMTAKGGSWTLEDLASFIHKPKDFVPKTAMTFRGIKKDAKLVKLLAYLKTLR